MKEFTEIKTYYVAEDGKRFETVEQCTEYENSEMVPTLKFNHKDIVFDESRKELYNYVDMMLGQFDLHKNEPSVILNKLKNMLVQLKNNLKDDKIYEC